MQDIDSILEGETVEAETQEVAQEAAPVEAETEAKGETQEAEEATASEQQPQPESETPSLEELMKKVDGLQAAAIAERKKRQEAEARLQQDKPLPDVFENQEEFAKAIKEQIGAATLNERANISEFMARREHPDLDAKIEKFKELQEADPTLANRVRNAVSPFHEIADIVTKAEKLAKLDDVDKMESEMRARLEADIRKKLEAEYAEKSKVADSIPPTLSDAASAGGIKSNSYAGPTPLDNLLTD